jgi:hypothetical protein
LLYPDAKFENYKFEMVPSGDHYKQFVQACRGEGATSTPFSYSGPLTEAVLCGTVAMRCPNEQLAWNARKLEFSSKHANSFIRRTYRKGWRVKNL